MNLSAVKTVQPGKYDFNRANMDVGDKNTLNFLACILRHKQVVYDWGQHHFFAYPVQFTIDYDKGTILEVAESKAIDEKLWVGCDPEGLHAHLANVFEGDWGPTSVDTILMMERSGIRVDLSGTKKFGPENPKEFLEKLRQTMR